MIGQQNAIDRLFEQQAARQEGHDIEQEHHLLAAVDDELYNQALVNLLTAHSLPHSLVEWPEWYAMLHTVNYMAPGVVTQSRGQVPKLLEASFITHREKLRSKLKSSLTQVHFSIDIWSSPNHHSLLGIVAHFIDRECRQLRKALLALRELEGAHSGEAIAETFLTVIDSYGLHGQVGYFTLDNAYNNDTMLQAIAKACDFDTAHRRLRCNGHIINLAVQAFLFGRNKDASDEALRQVSQLSKDEQEGVADRRDTATAWRRHGALGMLHNLVVWVRSSGQRYQAFSKAAGRMIPQDNSTRWNSWYLMIHVAIKARKEVNSFIDDHYTEGDISLDYLHPEHWQELQEIHDFLQPFHEITKDTQWDNSSLDEVICSMDFLITHYKASTEKFRHSLTMTDRIMTSWYKFDDYYRRTDDSPVYAAAILLHPSLRRAHLHEAWKDQSQYIGPAVEAVRKLWEDYKPRQVPTINEDLSAYEAYKQRIYQPPSSHDEFNRFIDGPTLPIGSSSALSWWLEPTQATSFPNLYRLAVNIFSIPAMSAEAERVFSGARRTITWDRSRLSVKTIEQTECLKHWMKSGLLDRAFMSPDTTESSSPYISNCNYDGAGAVLSWMYGNMTARNDDSPKGATVSFDQTGTYGTAGMDRTGYLYVPAACKSGGSAVCKLHVALHGCLQSYSQIGSKYIDNTGFKKWADTNNIIVLFPQAVPDYASHTLWTGASLPNPGACWDWVGWYGCRADQKGGEY
ncbi:gamma-thionin family domain-containing protein [Purpureocillium lavendulum]|uniref:Gamma-thionin family domain-containing protein n=1 Tax=Purpureocillium lavendulum TaxID=1247861 RepID=A0AB34FE32_9HYPO|nr:gamma-thionin family domain-containing protein [Purpureocillium lavendulum]